jgi:DNA-binding CsgD family transcriptional regulator
MTDRVSPTYGPTTITSQPNTDSTNEIRTTVPMTPAETRVLVLLPTHRTLSAIGNQLGMGRPTVKTHVEHIYKKLGATTRAEAVRLAESAGFLPR